jgi:hypothetical protein
VIRWFKSKKNISIVNGKSDCLSNRHYGSRNNNTHPKLGISKFIRNCSGLRKLRNNIVRDNRNGNRAHLFFIGRHLADKEKREKKLTEHYDKLRTGVLENWLKHTAILEQRKWDFPEPPIPLYVNIAETITNPIYYSRVKDHFAHDEYKEINQIIDNILEGEPKHNETVANFMKTIEQRIRKVIKAKDASMKSGGCVITLIQEHKFAEAATLLYVLEAIVQYFWNKLDNPIIEMEIGLADERTNTFRVFRQDSDTELGRGDEDTMKCLLAKLRILESEVVFE